MKISYKILLWTMMIMAAAFGVSGYFFVNYVFETSMEREVGQAMDDSSILQFAFETAALNIPSKYDVLQDSTIEEIGFNLENGGRERGRLLRLSDEEKKLLYVSDGFTEDHSFLERIETGRRIYQVIQHGERYYVQTGSAITTLDRIVYLETMKDVTQVFQERTKGFEVYRQVTLMVLICTLIVMSVISWLLTKPIRLLTRAARKMAEGDYSYRAKQISRDEMGQLTNDFNLMANALEENIHQLEAENHAKEEFIAAFSHELKTPLTAIIGYADLLRSRKLDEEKQFLSANYIYTEGKRLETMSFRLLDLIVTKRGNIEPVEENVDRIFEYLRKMYENHAENPMQFTWDRGTVYGEIDLLKTVLLNLVDNAIKASEPESKVEICGRRTETGYGFWVRDYGVGIPEEECRKITEAFYMVDKSRSRSRNGAGLGLALCTAILKQHNSRLEIESVLGEGSNIGFVIPAREVSTNEE